MKAVILAGGLGTRISEESHLRTKSMIEIGGKPILCLLYANQSDDGSQQPVVALVLRWYTGGEYTDRQPFKTDSALYGR